jgi:hypothetical protein
VSGWQETDSKSKRISPAKVPEGCPARQVRFMSTQKWEHWDTPGTRSRRRGPWCRSQHTRCTHRAGVECIPFPAHIARYACAAGKCRTAPLLSIIWSALAWVATNFLHSDHHTRQLVRPVLLAARRGSPPPLVRSRADLSKQASARSSIPHISYPSGFARIHPPLPQAPDGHCRRAERYDGKRDMYFQHAA